MYIFLPILIILAGLQVYILDRKQTKVETLMYSEKDKELKSSYKKAVSRISFKKSIFAIIFMIGFFAIILLIILLIIP